MKDFLLLILQIVVMACVAGMVGTLLNYFFGWHIGYKGAELPNDPGAAAMFLAAAAVCGAISYFAGRKHV